MSPSPPSCLPLATLPPDCLFATVLIDTRDEEEEEDWVAAGVAVAVDVDVAVAVAVAVAGPGVVVADPLWLIPRLFT